MLAALPQALPEQVQRDAAAVRGQALFRVGRPVDAVRALVEREVWLADAASILANQRMIWDGFRATPPATPAARRPAIPSSTAGSRSRRSPRAPAPICAARCSRGGKRTPTHPAAAGLLAELLAAQRSTAFPSQIALLLPLSSPQRALALAIRDGFMAAHLRNPSNTATNVRVYDSARLGGSRGLSASAARRRRFHRRAVAAGTEVDQVVAQAGFVPTLALNFATNDTTFLSSFYQFALAPEDEARAIAAAAIASGAKTAIAFVPSNQRGYRDQGQLPRRVRGGRRRAARLVRLRAGAAGFLAADGGVVERHAQPRAPPAARGQPRRAGAISRSAPARGRRHDLRRRRRSANRVDCSPRSCASSAPATSRSTRRPTIFDPGTHDARQRSERLHLRGYAGAALARRRREHCARRAAGLLAAAREPARAFYGMGFDAYGADRAVVRERRRGVVDARACRAICRSTRRGAFGVCCRSRSFAAGGPSRSTHRRPQPIDSSGLIGQR